MAWEQAAIPVVIFFLGVALVAGRALERLSAVKEQVKDLAKNQGQRLGHLAERMAVLEDRQGVRREFTGAHRLPAPEDDESGR